MNRLAPAMACCGAVCALALAGCVADRSAPQRSALWVSQADSSGGRWGKKEEASPQLHLAYAQMQEQMGHAKEARASYETVLGADPRNADAVLGLARLDQLAGRTEKAEKGFQRALQLRPKDAATLDALGQFYAAEKNWAEAIPHLQAAAAADPEKREYRYHLGLAIARSGNPEEALPHLAKTVGVAEAHYNVGYVLFERGDLAAAEKHFLTASLKNPNLAVAHQMLDEIRNTQAQPKVLPASSTEKPRLERSLPFPANESAAAARGDAGDHRRAPGAVRRAGATESNRRMARGDEYAPPGRPSRRLPADSRGDEPYADATTERGGNDDEPTVPFGAGVYDTDTLDGPPADRAEAPAESFGEPTAGQPHDAPSRAPSASARATPRPEAADSYRTQFEQWQNQTRR